MTDITAGALVRPKGADTALPCLLVLMVTGDVIQTSDGDRSLNELDLVLTGEEFAARCQEAQEALELVQARGNAKIAETGAAYKEALREASAAHAAALEVANRISTGIVS